MTTADAFDNRIIGGGFPQAAPLAAAICSGILITVGVIDIIDQPDLGYDEWLGRQFDAIPGLFAHTPTITLEGIGYGTEVPSMPILDMDGDDEPLTQDEMDYLAAVMKGMGYPEGSVVIVLSPTLIHELELAIQAIKADADLQVVHSTLSKSGKYAFESMWEQHQEGNDVILSDKSGNKISYVPKIVLMKGSGTIH